MQTHRRSIAKAVSYRLFATTTVFLIAFLYTGGVTSAAKIGVTAAVAKTALYYLWERVWNHIAWGQRDPAKTDATAETLAQGTDVQSD